MQINSALEQEETKTGLVEFPFFLSVTVGFFILDYRLLKGEFFPCFMFSASIAFDRLLNCSSVRTE